jgi:hypothetical protein
MAVARMSTTKKLSTYITRVNHGNKKSDARWVGTKPMVVEKTNGRVQKFSTTNRDVIGPSLVDMKPTEVVILHSSEDQLALQLKIVEFVLGTNARVVEIKL